MKTYKTNKIEYFYDRSQKQWIVYPIDSSDNRIEWDANDNPMEVKYFNNKIELNSYLRSASCK